MAVIVDTCVWVDVERGRLTPNEVARHCGDEPVYVAPPVMAELEYGVSKAKTAAQRNRRASAVARIKRKPCLIMDRDTGELFGRIAADISGRPPVHRIQDLWLAALALQNGMKILTQNERDFADIPGLDLIVIKKPA